MGILRRYHNLKEHIRIFKFQVREALKTNRIFIELLKLRWKTIVWLFLLIVGSFFTDLFVAYWVTPALVTQSWYNSTINILQLPQNDVTIGLLSSIISGVAAVIGILLAISLLVFQLAAEKFPYRMVRFLIQEKVGTYVIDFLIISFLFSLWTLFFLNRGSVFPIVSITLSLVLATLSILFVFVYRDHSLYYLRPKQGFEAASHQAQNNIYTLFKDNNSLGPSVSQYLRKQTDEGVQVIKDFLGVLSEKKDSDYWYGSMNLAKILSYYVTEKRFINPKSEWFPSMDVSISHQPSITSYELLAPFEELALGDRYIKKPNYEWLEREILQALLIAHEHAIRNDDLMSITSSISGYSTILEKSFEHQEYDVIDLTLQNVDDFVNQSLIENRLEKSIELYNLLMLIAESSWQGLDYNKLKEALINIHWESKEEIVSKKLPKILNDQLLAYQKKMKTELIIEGKYVTPNNLIEAELSKNIVTIEQDLSQKYCAWVFFFLDKLYLDSYTKRQENQIRNVLLIDLRVLRRGIVLNKPNEVQKNITMVRRHNLQAYGLLNNKQLRLEVFTEVKLSCLNAIRAMDVSIASNFYEMIVEIIPLEFQDDNQFFPDEALESLMIVSSLAYLYAEFYQEKPLFWNFMGILFAHFNMRILVPVFEQILEHQTLEYSIKYHHWFKDTFLKIHELPVVDRPRGNGIRGFDMVYDHPSEFIQNVTTATDIEECTEAMIEELRGLIT